MHVNADCCPPLHCIGVIGRCSLFLGLVWWSLTNVASVWLLLVFFCLMRQPGFTQNDHGKALTHNVGDPQPEPRNRPEHQTRHAEHQKS